ncbi:MAG: glycosyltransferase [Nitrospirae bacterium]|nr:MAG: glycosyltransferase [Nitrospirota bacterium]
MIRILYITTGTGVGGAERQLATLLPYLAEVGLEPAVISLIPLGATATAMEQSGVTCWSLELQRPLDLPRASFRLRRLVRHFQPDLIQGWMYHGNLAALWAARSAGDRLPVVWGVRQSLVDLQREKPGTRVVIRLSALLSRRPQRIVYNAVAARQQHESFGFASERGTVIGNCFDSQRWHPDDLAREDVRRELGVPEDAPIIGLIARYHPMKGHKVFFEAARILALRRSEVHFLLAGTGVEAKNPHLSPWLHDSTLANRLHLLGERADVERLTAALDIASSSSWGEAFSNTIAEALLCAVPVVATAVGDAARIIGQPEWVVPPGDAQALAAAWERLLALPATERRRLADKKRERMLQLYGLESIGHQYVRLYEMLSSGA